MITQTALLPVEKIPDPSPEDIQAALLAPVLAIDIETETTWTGVGPREDFGLSYPAPVTYVSFAWAGGTGVFQAPFSDQAIAFITAVMGDQPKVRVVVGHNLVFDLRSLARYGGGQTPENTYCTMTLARLLKPELAHFDLLAVAYGFGVAFPDWLKAMKGKRANLSDLPADKVAEYATWDARLTLALYEAQQACIVDEKIYDLVDWENRAVAVYCRMAARGIAINQPFIEERIAALTATIEAAEKALAADGLFKPNSPKERVKYIYEAKALPKPSDPAYYTAKGGLSTSVDVVEALAGAFPEHAGKLSLLRGWMQANWTLNALQALQEHAALDGRIHSDVSVKTATGRRASSNPNIQNLPMKSALPNNFCGVLTADDGYTLVEIDYSNAENWMAALLSGDSALAAACSAGDFHEAMAAQYFGDRWAQADKETRKSLRSMSKSITFGTAYGMGAKKLAHVLGLSEAEAHALLDAKDRFFPAVALAKKLASRKASGEGYINLWTGRRVPVPASQLYVSWDYLCQGGVGEMLKRSIVLIDEAFQAQGLKSRVAHDMHDAIILEVAHEEWQMALDLASGIMGSILPDDLNQRTDPPIRWIAQPDLTENARKWGKGQHHPAQIAVEPPPVKRTKRTVTIRFADMDWQGQLVYVDGQLDRESARAYFAGLKAATQAALNGPYTVPFPGKGEIKVNLENRIKVDSVWLANADKVDLREAVGMGQAVLQGAMEDAQDYLAQLRARLVMAEKWLKELAA